MGKGRKPTPDALKALRGTDQPCRMKGTIEVSEIKDVTQILDLKGLKILTSKRAKDIFIQKANQLIGLKLLTDMDIEQLVIYSHALDTLFTCIKGMKVGLFDKVYNDDGKLKGSIPNPHIKLYREMAEIVNRIGSDFGFSPVARMKLKAEKEPSKDPLQELFEKFNQ